MTSNRRNSSRPSLTPSSTVRSSPFESTNKDGEVDTFIDSVAVRSTPVTVKTNRKTSLSVVTITNSTSSHRSRGNQGNLEHRNNIDDAITTPIDRSHQGDSSTAFGTNKSATSLKQWQQPTPTRTTAATSTNEKTPTSATTNIGERRTSSNSTTKGTNATKKLSEEKNQTSVTTPSSTINRTNNRTIQQTRKQQQNGTFLFTKKQQLSVSKVHQEKPTTPSSAPSKLSTTSYKLNEKEVPNMDHNNIHELNNTHLITPSTKATHSRNQHLSIIVPLSTPKTFSSRDTIGSNIFSDDTNEYDLRTPKNPSTFATITFPDVDESIFDATGIQVLPRARNSPRIRYLLSQQRMSPSPVLKATKNLLSPNIVKDTEEQSFNGKDSDSHQQLAYEEMLHVDVAKVETPSAMSFEKVKKEETAYDPYNDDNVFGNDVVTGQLQRNDVDLVGITSLETAQPDEYATDKIQTNEEQPIVDVCAVEDVIKVVKESTTNRPGQDQLQILLQQVSAASLIAVDLQTDDINDVDVTSVDNHEQESPYLVTNEAEPVLVNDSSLQSASVEKTERIEKDDESNDIPNTVLASVSSQTNDVVETKLPDEDVANIDNIIPSKHLDEDNASIDSEDRRYIAEILNDVKPSPIQDSPLKTADLEKKKQPNVVDNHDDTEMICNDVIQSDKAMIAKSSVEDNSIDIVPASVGVSCTDNDVELAKSIIGATVETSLPLAHDTNSTISKLREKRDARLNHFMSSIGMAESRRRSRRMIHIDQVEGNTVMLHQDYNPSPNRNSANRLSMSSSSNMEFPNDNSSTNNNSDNGHDNFQNGNTNSVYQIQSFVSTLSALTERNLTRKNSLSSNG